MNHHPAGLSHLLQDVRTAEVEGAKDRCRHALGVAAENLSAAGAFPETTHPVLRRSNRCPKCGGELVDEPARKAEPDTGVRAFAGGTACDDCGAEFEAEDTRDDYDWHRIRRGQVFLLPLALCLFAGWLTLPTAPTPIDDSLPSSTGPHSPARGSAPGKDAWSGPLWTT